MLIWNGIEDAEPDISTEMLIERVISVSGYTHDEVLDAVLIDTEKHLH